MKVVEYEKKNNNKKHNFDFKGFDFKGLIPYSALKKIIDR